MNEQVQQTEKALSSNNIIPIIKPMSMQHLQRSLEISNDTSQPTLKQLNSLSTLTYHKTPSPPLINTNINFSRFKSIDVTEKAKKKLGSNCMIIKNEGNAIKSRRNQSMGSIPTKDLVNPENGEMRITNTSKKESDVDFFELNKQANKQAKARNFMNKLFGNKKSTNNPINPSQKLDMTLPVISHKKAYSKRSNFLQQWLDQTLDPQDLSPDDNNQLSMNQNGLLSSSGQLNLQHLPMPQSSQSSYLSTVKKYQIDRTYLKSQNIPSQIIERLYNTLFIYTHGINTVFSELLGFVKPTSGEDAKDPRILSNFWKCFVKLLEGCTSFQTSFQKVEEQYVLRVNQLKQLLIKKQSEFMKQREQLNQMIVKFEKERVQMMNNYSKLQSDHRIAVSTLQLTDHAFNQEVQLRLKFQQKINHIYSSYQELRIKYQTIMSTLQIKNQQSYEKASLQQKLNQRNRQLQTFLQQHKDLLSKQKQKVHQRQLQVSIKRQQLLDLQMNLQLKQEKEQQDEDVMVTEIGRNALLKTKVEELENRVNLMGFTNDGLAKKLRQEKQTVEAYRKMNDQLHAKYNEASQKLVQYEAHKIYQSAQITKLATQLQITSQKLSLTTYQKTSLQSKLSMTLQQLHQTQYQLQTKTSAMQNINATIQDLKAIKNKYEQLWKIMEREKSELQHQRNRIQQQYQLEKQEFVGLKMLSENRQKYIKDIETKNQKQKELLKRKIAGYNQIVTKKESMILALQKTDEDKSDLLLKRNYRIQQLQKQLTDQKTLIKREANRCDFLEKRVQQLEKEVKSTQQKLKLRGNELQQKLTEFDMTSQQLSSVKTLLSLIKEQQNSSITNFSTLFEDYRQLVLRKGQHIHPMLYEDLTQQYNRLKLDIIPGLKGEILELKEEKQTMKREIEGLRQVIGQKDQEIIGLNQGLVIEKRTISQKVKQIQELTKQIKTLQKTISSQSSQLTNSQQTIIQKQQSITQLTTDLQTANQTLSHHTSSLSVKQMQIQNLTANINLLSEKLATCQAEIQTKQKHNPYLIKIQKLEKNLEEAKNNFEEVRKELEGLKNVVKEDQQIQTEPQQGQVVILQPKQQTSNLRKNKFFINQSTIKTESKQIQVTLPPYDSIPEYINTKIHQIKRQGLSLEQNDSKVPSGIKSKSKDSPEVTPLNSKESLTKLDPINIKEPVTRRQELRRALRFTYMRR